MSASRRATASFRCRCRPMSNAVRAVVVTGMPATRVISSSASLSLRTSSPLWGRALGAISSMGVSASIHRAPCNADAAIPLTTARSAGTSTMRRRSDRAATARVAWVHTPRGRSDGTNAAIRVWSADRLRRPDGQQRHSPCPHTDISLRRQPKSTFCRTTSRRDLQNVHFEANQVSAEPSAASRSPAARKEPTNSGSA